MTMITNNLPTKQLQALDAAHHMHPFTANAELAEKGARVITRAEGVYLTDSEGHRILDGMAGLWCMNIGYGRSEMADVAARQMRELPYYNTFFQTTHVPAIALAAKLAELAPGDLNHVFFAGSGSESNDTNLLMVRRYWQALGHPEKNIVIARKNAYHGSTYAGRSLGGMSGMHEQGGIIANIEHIGQPHWYMEGGDMTPEEFGLMRARELEDKILELGVDRVAAFIGEPVQGAGGVIVPPPNYWPLVRQICDKHGVLLIADEVVTGLGRSGELFGTRLWGVNADMWCLAKGISSGYIPLGATAINRRIAEVFDADTTGAASLSHGYTYSAHPVAAAAALATLDQIEALDIPGHAARVGAHMQARLRKLTDTCSFVGDVRGVGLMLGIEMVSDKARRIPLARSSDISARVAKAAYQAGLMVRISGPNLILSPPLTITREEVDFMCDVLESAFAAVEEGRA